MNKRQLVMLLAAVSVPAAAGAQVWRTVDVSRQLHDTSALYVRVEYGAGRFDLRAARTPVLYSMQLRYDETAATPLHTYDAVAGTLKLGLQNESTRWIHRGDDDSQASMRLALAPTVPMDLSLTLGATQAHVDLGGLTLRGLTIGSGAADETVDFSSPNRTRLGDISINVGAASFTATNLANARADGIRVSGGVGSVTLGFDGEWTADLDANVKVTLGQVTLRIPDDVGVRLDVDRFLTSFDHEGLEKRDGYYYSDNWNTARYKLRARVATTLGAITVRRIPPSSHP
ncbi:MAG TPA: hypothetical protein VFK16_11020 [Gemmatimonadaceae bacterium]|jgi:hypothetical protein|nr:hypothetical protein [Gemmatimonadaceae bacterium]